jgi:integrase
MAVTSTLIRYEDPLEARERTALAGFLAGYSGNTRVSYTTDLRLFAGWCADSGIRLFGVRRAHLEIFARTMEQEGRMRSTVGLDRNELGAVLVQAGLGSPRDHAPISLLALNGLRISEALGADIDDVDIDRGHRTLKIVRKGGKQVTIPLAPRAARTLDLYIGERTSGPIFLGAAGGRMDRYAADRAVKRLARRAGITKRISPHSLRHSFITVALDAGVPLRDVQEAASHADPRTTMRYDLARQSLDRHATYIVAAFVAGAAR